MQKMRMMQWFACLMLVISLVVPNVAWAHEDGEHVKVRLLGLNGMSYEAYVEVEPTEYINTAGDKVAMSKPTVMGALVELAKKYNLSYEAQTSAYGAYVTQIAGLEAKAINENTGWSAYINGQSLQVASDQAEVKDGDSITWAFVDFMNTLTPKVKFSTTTPQFGEEITVTVTADKTTYDADWKATTETIPVEGATVYWTHGVGDGADRTLPKTNKDGVAKFKPEHAGLITVVVFKDDEKGLPLLLNSDEFHMRVGNKNANYQDLNGYGWAKAAIDQLAAKGIISTEIRGNTYAPGKAVTRHDLAELLTLSGDVKDIGGSATFTDITLATPYMTTVARLGYMQGDAEGTFRPDDKVTREEFAVVLSRFAGLDVDAAVGTQLNFSDNGKVSTWATPFVKAAVANGLLVGDAAGTFRPQASLNRAEIATALTKVMNKQAN